ncbi:MAG TPA: ATP-binding protein [Gammaproteobacteria bacterium]|jgi:hypothetical protein
MGISPSEYNLTVDDVLSRIADLMTKNGWGDREFLIESVFSAINGGLHVPFAVIRPYEENLARPLAGDVLDYRDLILRRDRVDAAGLSEILRTIQSQGRMTISNMTGVVQSGGAWSAESFPGGNIHDSRACLVLTRSLGSNYGMPSSALVNYSYPYFENPTEAINAFCGMQLNEHDSRLNNLYIVVPDTQAYFAGMTLTDRGLTVQIGGSIDLGKLRLKGQMSIEGKAQKISTEVVNNEATIEISSSPASISVWLVGKPDIKYDHYAEPIFYGQKRSFEICAKESGGATADLVADAINTGEGETLEFKPFISLGNPKEKEILRTVVAFSNSDGGQIIFGLSDEAQIVGIEQGLRSLATPEKESTEKLAEKYINALKERINHSIRGSLSLRYRTISYGNHTLLVVDIEPSKNPPVYLLEGNEIFIRKGANNVRPNPESDLARFYRPSSFGSGG